MLEVVCQTNRREKSLNVAIIPRCPDSRSYSRCRPDSYTVGLYAGPFYLASPRHPLRISVRSALQGDRTGDIRAPRSRGALVFAQFYGSLGVVFGPKSGYLFSYPFAVTVVGLAVNAAANAIRRRALWIDGWAAGCCLCWSYEALYGCLSILHGVRRGRCLTQ